MGGGGGGGGGVEGHVPTPPPPTLSLAPYLAQSLTLVPHSLLRNRTEMLAMQAIHLHTYQDGVYMFGDHSDNTGTYY